MRAPLRTLLSTLVLTLAACISGRRVILVEVPSQQQSPPPPRPVAVMKPAPLPAPQPREALEVTLGRPARGQLPIQTNRAAYVAIFEIVPDQGVTLVQPTSTQRRRVTPAGVSAVGAWWSDSRVAANAQPARYIYIVAADQPLRLSDQAYQSDYWQRALGASAYRGSNLYATMRAISRVVVPAVTEQDWAEDMLAVAPTYARQSPQQVPTARVYCPDGSVREVPMDFADRAICPMRVGSNDGRWARGDSAFSNGRRVDGRGPRGPNPVDRISDPSDPHYGARNDPRNGNDRRGGRPTPRPTTPVTPAPANPTPVTPEPARPPRRDEPPVHPTPTPTPNDRNDAKRDAREERKEAKQDAKDERREAKNAEQDARKAEQEAKKAEHEEQKDAKKEAQSEAKDARSEAKPDAKPETKPEPAAESKPESKPEPKAEPKQDAKPEAKDDAKPEAKDDAKPEQKDSARDDRGEAKDDRKGEGQQPDGDQRRAPGRPASNGKPNPKS